MAAVLLSTPTCSPLSVLPILHRPYKLSFQHNPILPSLAPSSPRRQKPRPSRVLRASASTEAVVENAQKIAVPAATNDGVGSTVVSALLTVAFVGLSVLTVGVIYIAVTDFLGKREREKFEKEEAANKKKGKKKVKVKARAGPRGFGQKIVEDDDDDD